MFDPNLAWQIQKIEAEEFYEKHKHEIAKEELFSIYNVCPVCRDNPSKNCYRCHGTGKYVENELRKHMFKNRD